VELRAATVALAGVVVLSRVTLSISEGVRAAVVGPPGAGKSTLLRCLTGALPLRAGEARIMGRAPGQARQSIGFAPAQDQVDWRFPMAVVELVSMGRDRPGWLFRRRSSDDRAVVQRTLDEVGLSRVAERRLSGLTVGERSRALLARALAQEPALLLLDDPLQGADPESEEIILLVLRRWRERGKTALVATRDLNAVGNHHEQLVLLNGQVVAEGCPDDVLGEANLRATFGERPVWLKVPVEHFATDAGLRRR
jgi:manganese/zinc/iron transport system ATP- binding protein